MQNIVLLFALTRGENAHPAIETLLELLIFNFAIMLLIKMLIKRVLSAVVYT